MRNVIILMCLFSFIQGYAQIDIRMDYDAKNKDVVLLLESKSDVYYNLRTKEFGDSFKFLNTVTFTYKDREDNLLYSIRRLIYDEQFHQTSYLRGAFLYPHTTNRYIHKLRRWYDGDDVYKVEVLVKIDARIVDPKQERGGKATEQDTYKTEFRKTVLW